MSFAAPACGLRHLIVQRGQHDTVSGQSTAVRYERSRLQRLNAPTPERRLRRAPQHVQALARCGRNRARLPSREWTKIFSISVVLFFVIRTFLVEAFKIPSGSMERTLLVGDFLLVNKLVYGAEVPFTQQAAARRCARRSAATSSSSSGRGSQRRIS